MILLGIFLGAFLAPICTFVIMKAVTGLSAALQKLPLQEVDISWMEQIPKMIKQDIRLQLQDPVIETSL